MKNKMFFSALKSLQAQWRIAAALVGALVLILAAIPASAMIIYTDDDWNVRWDNTPKYTFSFRVAPLSAKLLSNINADDGDQNFKRWGVISNRFDMLSEFDAAYHKDWGFHASAAGWVDSVYLSHNENGSPATFNGFDVAHNNQFPGGTELEAGGTGELLDAFVYGKCNVICNMPFQFRVGRYSLVWGETLWNARNGIAYGQQPLDLAKVLSVPSTLAKELFMPLGRVGGTLQVTDLVSVSAYADFEQRRDRDPESGSFFSDLDILDAGGQRLLLTPNPGPYFARGVDIGGGPSTGGFGQAEWGNFGASTRFRLSCIDADWGLYYHRFSDTNPQVYLFPGRNADLSVGRVGEYSLVYPKNISSIGASIGTQVGPVNVSGEVSGRLNQDLASNPLTQIALPAPPGFPLADFSPFIADNNGHALYAIGDTLHVNISGIYLMPPGPVVCGFRLWDGGTAVMGEIAFVDLLSITENAQNYDTTRSNWAVGLRGAFEPAYYQVCQGVDLSFPITVGFNPQGKSPQDLHFNGGGADKGGDVTLGMAVTYNSDWHFGLAYTTYFGGHTWFGPQYSVANQDLADRDFVSMYIRRTF